MLNQVILIGRLVKEPEFEIKGNYKICKIRLAVQREFRNKDDGNFQTDYFLITLWSGLAEITNEYCKKGTLVSVKGRLETNEYLDAEGQKKKIMNIVGEKIIFLDPREQVKEIEDEMSVEEDN